MRIWSAVALLSLCLGLSACIDDAQDNRITEQPRAGGQSDVNGEPVGGTPDDEGHPVNACLIDGQFVSPGETVDSGDGCNTCTCQGGGLVRCTQKECINTMSPCTLMECGPAPGAPQRLCPDGVNYEGPGECQRLDNGMCGYPMQTCPPTQGGMDPCTPQECGPAPGAPQELCPDGENYNGFGPCQRLDTGECGYPRVLCPPGPAHMSEDPCENVLCEMGAVCLDGECILPCEPGAQFLADDGCNSCVCPESGNRQDAACTERACASSCTQDSDCDEQSYCDFAGDGCGLLARTGVCRLRDRVCPEPGGVPTCGCDGTLRLNRCELANQGTDHSRLGGCTQPDSDTFSCGDQRCDGLTQMCSVAGNDVGGENEPEFFFQCVMLPDGCQPGDCACAAPDFGRCAVIGSNTMIFTPGG